MVFPGKVVPVFCNWTEPQSVLCNYSWLLGPQAVLKWMVPLAEFHVQERHGLCFMVKRGPYVVLCNQSGHQAVPNLDKAVG